MVVSLALRQSCYMMTSSNGNIFRVTSPLCGEFTGQRWIPHTKARESGFDVFFNLHLNKRFRGWWFETPIAPIMSNMGEINIWPQQNTTNCISFAHSSGFNLNLPFRDGINMSFRAINATGISERWRIQHRVQITYINGEHINHMDANLFTEIVSLSWFDIVSGPCIYSV